MVEMEQRLDHGKFWLPAEFLDDEDDVFMEVFKSGKHKKGMNSDLSSPVEFVTENEEEDYLNDLSRQVAQFTLEDSLLKTESSFKSIRVMAGSPQSTLCGLNRVSSRGSSNCPSPPAPVSQVESPPAPMSQVESSWDVLCAAAGEVARLRMTEEAGFKHNVSPQPPRRIPSPNPQFHQIQAAQMKKQQILLQQQQQYQQFVLQNRAITGGGNTKPVTPPLSSWPTLQQSKPQQPPPPQPQPGSGMRAVFLGNRNTKRECTGTGVFLPRQIGAPIEPRKKRGCATVLLPDRVVKALNLNLEPPQTRSNCGRPRHDYDSEMKYRNSVLTAEQRRQEVVKDLRLPQEWTY